MKRIASELAKLNRGKRAYAIFVLCAMTALALPAQTFTTRYSFDGRNGALPSAALVQATNGDLYGTTDRGGANDDGTVFKITPSGTLTTVYNFCSQSGCMDGLIQTANGDFYGTTYHGGASGLCDTGCGTVFKITPAGTLTTLYSFCSQSGCPDGWFPAAGLVQAITGDFYGTTVYGGANGLFYGTIFKITPGGALTTLYSFCSKSECPDSANPYAGLVQATTGDFYGTTRNAGAYGPYYGTIFKITPSGKLTTVYSFCSQIEKSGCTDGANPYAGLVQATNGDFFGTTEDGGTGGVGTVFKITPGGALTTLYSFCPQIGCTDGRYPYAGLVQASNGDFYGTTSEGGANNDGTIFEITPSGTLTTLYSFCSESGCTDGVHPSAALVQASNGDFYGTTNSGGAYGYGTVFEITPSGTLMALGIGINRTENRVTTGVFFRSNSSRTGGQLYLCPLLQESLRNTLQPVR